MLVGITILLVFQLAGEAIAYFLGGFVPGPVIGMAMIAVLLTLTGGVSFLEPAHRQTLDTSRAILANLGILFVPAGVGIMVHLHRVADEWLPLLLSLLISTLATLVVTALVMRLLQRTPPAAGDAP